MRWTAYPARRKFIAVIGSWIFVLAAALVTRAVPSPRVFVGTWILFGLIGALLLWMTLEVLVDRAVVTPSTVRFRSIRPRRNLRTTIEEIAAYVSDKDGLWWVETASRRVAVPVSEPWALHAAMVQLVPTKLGAKRLRPLHLPPAEEFRNLWTYDVEGLFSESVGRIVAVLLCFALTRKAGPAYGILVAPLLFGLPDWGSRLDVTDAGLVRRGPFHRREVRWSEATAIFCERPLTSRRFVVTGPETAIEIPAHLARDLELMRKVFRSLPEGTLCVNFDETTFRGYRRRKKAKEKSPARSEDLLPALTG